MEAAHKVTSKLISSQHSFSENGGNILSGRGLENIKTAIRLAFDRVLVPEPVHGGDPFYADVEARAKLFTAAALASKLYSANMRRGPVEISAPSESVDILYSLALGAQGAL